MDEEKLEILRNKRTILDSRIQKRRQRMQKIQRQLKKLEEIQVKEKILFEKYHAQIKGKKFIVIKSLELHGEDYYMNDQSLLFVGKKQYKGMDEIFEKYEFDVAIVKIRHYDQENILYGVSMRVFDYEELKTTKIIHW